MHPSFGNYRTEQLIRTSPQSNVYQVTDEQGKELILKTASLEQITNEVRIIKKANSPHIVKLRDFDLEAEQPYLVTEHAGLALSLLKKPKPYPEIQKIMTGIFIALEDIHSKDITHGDLKPGNVLCDDTVLLCDFAGSQDAGLDHTLTHTGSLTFGYVPPEVERGEKPTAKSDMYQAGIILYELCSGHQLRPHSPPIDSLNIPVQAKNLFKELIYADPKKRPNAKQARQKLQEIILEPQPRQEMNPVGDENYELDAKTSRYQNRIKLIFATGILAIGAALYRFTLYFNQQHPEPPRISYWFEHSQNTILFPVNLDASAGSPRNIPISEGTALQLEHLIHTAELNDRMTKNQILLDTTRNIRRRTYTPSQVETILFQLQDENGTITRERIERAQRNMLATKQGYNAIIAAVNSND